MTAAETGEGTQPATAFNGLFGRGLLYVVIWSLQLLVATIVSPVLAHTLTMSQFGALAAAIALYQLVIVLCVFGIDQALEVQRVEDGVDDHRARGLLAVGMVLGFVVTGVLLLTLRWWAPVFGFDEGLSLVRVTLLWTAPGTAVLLVLSLLQAEDRLRKFTVVSLISTVGAQLLELALLFGVRRDPVTYAWGGVIGQSIAFAIGVWWARPRLAGLRAHDVTVRALRLGAPLVVAGLSEFILAAGDRLIVQRWLGAEAVASYQVAFVVGNVVTLLLLFTNRAWLPRLIGIGDDAQRWRTIARARDGIYWLVGWSLIGVTVAAPALLRVFVPASYDRVDMTRIVFIVGLCALPVAAIGATSRMLISVRWSTPMAWSSAVAVLVKVAMTIGLLSVLGLSGAALGTLAALVAQAAFLREAVARRHPVIRSSRGSLGFLAAAVAVSGVSVLLPMTPAWDLGRTVFGALCLVPFTGSIRLLQRGELPIRPAGRHRASARRVRSSASAAATPPSSRGV
ncbi:lipopolysaccharide biosynthesis protein [Flexivirga meconopsidis]|uniref:lipopolysaccharide biosynthesis protein n=1 Tax=Flexivirga meconopsidis TaxID=2977121 RepID=UPI002240181B|nr:lipopolysaccharide biosynthesis protein [Flexivirga meconopsidis]